MARIARLLHSMGLDSVAFLFMFSSIVCICTHITCTSVGKSVFDYYSSCHGGSTIWHDVFLFLLGLQVLLIISSWSSVSVSSPICSSSYVSGSPCVSAEVIPSADLVVESSTLSYSRDVPLSPFVAQSLGAAAASSSMDVSYGREGKSRRERYEKVTAGDKDEDTSLETTDSERVMNSKDSIKSSGNVMYAIDAEWNGKDSWHIGRAKTDTAEDLAIRKVNSRRREIELVEVMADLTDENSVYYSNSSEGGGEVEGEEGEDSLSLDISRSDTDEEYDPEEKTWKAKNKKYIKNGNLYRNSNMNLRRKYDHDHARAKIQQRNTIATKDNYQDKSSTLDEFKGNENFTNNRIYRWMPHGICWNSIWMVCYYTVFFMGFHASLLSWRLYGMNDANPLTLDTCQHMKVKIFKEEIPLVRSVISDFTFIEVFSAVSSTMLFVRKYSDPYYLKSYICCPSMCWLRSLPSGGILFMQSILQLAIITTAAIKIASCWIYGYGTPMQIVAGFLLANVVLWIISVLTRVLQVDKMPSAFIPSLEFHWLWATICLGITWLCGFLFYLSVYGIQWTSYFIPHIISWAAFLFITAYKFDLIFPH